MAGCIRQVLSLGMGVSHRVIGEWLLDGHQLLNDPLQLFDANIFAPYRRMKQAIAAGDLPTAGAKLAQIRMIIGVNLSLGLIVIAVASGGRYL